jgi:hypothetical protein
MGCSTNNDSLQYSSTFHLDMRYLQTPKSFQKKRPANGWPK